MPVHRGQPGHPVRLPGWLRPRLLAPDDVPLRAVLHAGGARRLAVHDPWILENVNRPADLERLRAGALQPHSD